MEFRFPFLFSLNYSLLLFYYTAKLHIYPLFIKILSLNGSHPLPILEHPPPAFTYYSFYHLNYLSETLLPHFSNRNFLIYLTYRICFAYLSFNFILVENVFYHFPRPILSYKWIINKHTKAYSWFITNRYSHRLYFNPYLYILS